MPKSRDSNHRSQQTTKQQITTNCDLEHAEAAEKTVLPAEAAAAAASVSKARSETPRQQVEAATKAAGEAAAAAGMHLQQQVEAAAIAAGSVPEAGLTPLQAASIAAQWAQKAAADMSESPERQVALAAEAAAAAASEVARHLSLTVQQATDAARAAATKTASEAGLSDEQAIVAADRAVAAAAAAVDSAKKDGTAALAPGISLPTMPTMPPLPIVPPLPLPLGIDCWTPCHNQSGLCAYCGQGKACCRKSGDLDPPTECKDIPFYFTWHHECVNPVHEAAPAVAVADRSDAHPAESKGGSSSSWLLWVGLAGAAAAVLVVGLAGCQSKRSPGLGTAVV
ncbi:unnamed protein product [Polarella glacialis]|uniref:Uncharacterized protein n=1 Tax=Polarella glacialis TaxID=89957 RepID=A0A813E4K1_POLGL|nr:unnamed protein product [Polarella glacialis]